MEADWRVFGIWDWNNDLFMGPSCAARSAAAQDGPCGFPTARKENGEWLCLLFAFWLI